MIKGFVNDPCPYNISSVDDINLPTSPFYCFGDITKGLERTQM